jgi:hypothetical protein
MSGTGIEVYGPVAGFPPSTFYNVKTDFGAVGDLTHDDTVNIQNALNTASAAGGGTIYFPKGLYKVTSTLSLTDSFGVNLLGVNQSVTGARIIGFPGANPALFFDGTSSGSTGFLGISKLGLVSSGVGSVTLDLRNVLNMSISDAYIQGGNTALKVRGTGFLNVDVTNCIGGAYGLDLGDITGGLTSTVPVNFRNCIFGQVLTNAAVWLHGSYEDIIFQNCMFNANGALTTVIVDGGKYSTASFLDCHGESNFEPTNLGQDFLIGASDTPGAIRIIGGSYFGHGNGVNYRKYWARVVSVHSLIIEGPLLSKLGNVNGYNGAGIRLDGGYPAAGNTFRFSAIDKDDITNLYSDAAAKITANNVNLIANGLTDYSLL